MSVTNSPNMNLPVPGVGNEIGPNYANDVNNCFSILDGHDHTAGSGVTITPSAMTINTDLSFMDNNATDVNSVRMTSLSSALSGGSDLGCIYNNSGNLYFNDGSGNQIAITSAGGVAGSPGSIANLVSPASATYTAASKLFTWASGTSGKAAAMDNGAVTIRQTDTASAKGVTIASTNSLAADYQLTLPTALPASTQYLTSSNAGVLSFSTADAIGQAMTSTGANAVAASRTRSTGTTVGIGGVGITSSCGNFTTTSTSYVDVTNLAVTITTSGRPVAIGFISAGTQANLSVSVSGSSQSLQINCKILRDVTTVSIQNFYAALSTIELSQITIPCSSLSHLDVVAAGTYTYKLQLKSDTLFQTSAANNIQMVVYEI